MEELNGGQVAARQIAHAGIDTLFGVVAGPMIEVFAGAEELGLKVVGCRHEMNGAFMASAWGYQKRQPGIMVVGSGPGMSNAITPLYVATASAMPLVVLGGSALSKTTGLGAFQEWDQVALAAPACKWTGRVDSLERIPEWIHLAMGKALEGRPGGVYLDFPGELPAGRIPMDRLRLREAAEITRPHPDPASIERVAALLAKAERPLLVLGKGAAWADAGQAIARLADRGIPYICSPMSRGTIPDDHPNFANAARSQAMSGADVVVFFGARANWMFGLGRRFAADAKLVQIDVAAEEMASGARLELGLVADAGASAIAIAEAMEGTAQTRACGEWLAALQSKAAQNEAAARVALESDAVPINPYRVVHEVRELLPRDACITSEGETIMGICRAMIPSYQNRACLNAGTTGCMGVGAPYAVGAAIAHPERPSVAVLGDYAFGAAAMVVETARRVGVKAVLVVANNEGIAGHAIQDAMMPAGAPRIASLLPAKYEKIAEMVDGHAESVDKPEAIRPALERALAADTIAVVHVRVDPKAGRLGGANYLQ